MIIGAKLSAFFITCLRIYILNHIYLPTQNVLIHVAITALTSLCMESHSDRLEPGFSEQ